MAAAVFFSLLAFFSAFSSFLVSSFFAVSSGFFSSTFFGTMSCTKRSGSSSMSGFRGKSTLRREITKPKWNSNDAPITETSIQ